MRAARLHEIGGHLQVDDVDEPTPAEGEVLVDVAFAAVNPLDVWVAQGSTGAAAANLPWIPGTEATGHVDGRPVQISGAGLGVARPGLYRERAAVPSDTAIPLPDGVDLRQAAGIGVAGVTAWSSLHSLAHVGADDRVLVLGASGGVGALAVQLARAAGATVWGQTTQAAKEPMITGNGAVRAVVTDAAGLVDAVSDLAPTVVLDGLGGAFTNAAVEALAPHGRLVIYGTSSDVMATLNLRVLYRKGAAILGYAGLLVPGGERRSILASLVDQIAAGQLQVPVEVVPLDEADACHQRILGQGVTGKLILDTRA
jgi:NADPH2:quinone reductase